MTTLATTPPPQRPEHLFTVEEYLRMVSVGILTKRDKVELIEGRIVEKMPIDPPHVLTLEKVSDALKAACPTSWFVRLDSPLQLKKSALEPDIMVVRGQREDYRNHHPTGKDLLLVVEISDSTLHDDHEMAKIYAAASIPGYWIVNLADRRVEVYSNPTGPDRSPAYRKREDIAESGTVSLQFSPGAVAKFKVKDLLAPAE